MALNLKSIIMVVFVKNIYFKLRLEKSETFIKNTRIILHYIRKRIQLIIFCLPKKQKSICSLIFATRMILHLRSLGALRFEKNQFDSCIIYFTLRKR